MVTCVRNPVTAEFARSRDRIIKLQIGMLIEIFYLTMIPASQNRLGFNLKQGLSRGTIQDEFIHASGFTHERNRRDRDRSAQILFDNIPPGEFTACTSIWV